jgi:hypothetical protein
MQEANQHCDVIIDAGVVVGLGKNLKRDFTADLDSLLSQAFDSLDGTVHGCHRFLDFEDEIEEGVRVDFIFEAILPIILENLPEYFVGLVLGCDRLTEVDFGVLIFFFLFALLVLFIGSTQQLDWILFSLFIEEHVARLAVATST